MKLYFFILIAFALQTRIAAYANSCARDYALLQATKDLVAGNKFNIGRTLYDYEKIFGASFSNDLKNLGKNERWLDSGAGLAQAQGGFLKKSKHGDLVALGYEKPQRDYFSHPVPNSPRFKYLEGRLLEDIPNSELGKFKIITDYFGPGSYSPDFPQVLQKYLELLDDNGSIYLTIDKGIQNVVTTHRVISLGDWLQKIPGIKVEKLPGDREAIAFKIIKNGSAEVKIPKLEMKKFLPGAPPGRIYQVPGADIKKIPWQSQILPEPMPASLFTDFKKPAEVTSGTNHVAVYRAKYQMREAFLKVSFAENRTTEAYQAFKKEASWSQRLSDLKIGPDFIGTTKLENGYTIATKWIEGNHVSDIAEFSQSKNLINSNTLHDLEKIREIFRVNGIIPVDFQFRIDRDGHVWVVDPAFYMQRGRDVPENYGTTGLGAVDKYIQFTRDSLQ